MSLRRSALEEHLVHLRKILELRRQHKLYAKMSKCAFCLPKVEYIGHLLSDIGISVENTKVDTIREWPIPRRKTDVQSFLGVINFYRRFITSCARISKPLTQLTGNTPFKWDGETQNAFDQLKKALCTAPLLRAFDPTLPIIVTTDASEFAIGAVLEQDEVLGLPLASRTS
jgi:hypothetical protein